MTINKNSFEKHFNKVSKDYLKSLNKISKKNERANLDKTIYQPYYLLGIKNACKTMLDYVDKDTVFFDYGNGVSNIGAALSKYVGEVFSTDIIKEDWNHKLWFEMSAKYDFFQYILSGEEDLPHEDSSFDAVCMYAVLEHIERDENKIYEKFNEMCRVVKPGGYLFIFKTPQKYSYVEWLAKILGIPHHKVLMDTNRFKKQVKSLGFDVVKFRKYTVLPDFLPVKFLERLQNKYAEQYHSLDTLLGKFPPLNFLSHDFMAVLQKKATQE